jgi:hypothetical protein
MGRSHNNQPEKRIQHDKAGHQAHDESEVGQHYQYEFHHW